MTQPSEDLTPPPATVDLNATLSHVSDPDATRAPDATPVSASTTDNRAPAGYVIEKQLGRGGMGVVYLARETRLDRRCALKMILSGAYSSEAEIERFRTEAQAIARLQHPGIVQVFEIGEHDGKPFMALEYCAGGSLDAVLAKNPLPAKEAATLVQALALAMQVAHEAHVIHRDLKPANVLLTTDRQPKITDFGLAKKLDEDGATRTGSIMGTPSYMPPEQAEGRRDIGPAADIYALGAILYECLTGRPPFKAATALETIHQVLKQEPVALQELNAGVPRDLATITHKCLQKDPDKRYATARDLADDLGRFLAGEPIVARPVGRVERAVKWVRRNPVVSALATAVVLVLTTGIIASWILTVWALQEKSNAETFAKGESAARNTAQLREADALREEKAARAQLRRAEDARHAIMIDLIGRARQERQYDRMAQLLTEIQPEYHDTWETCYFRNLWLKGEQANPDQPWITVLGAKCIRFSPDGECVFVSRSNEPDRNGPAAQLVDVHTGQPFATFKGHTKWIECIDISPDGKRVLTGSGDNTARIWNTATGQELATCKGHTFRITSVCFSPDGTRVLTSSFDNTARLWDASTGEQVQIFQGHQKMVHHVCFSPDGAHVLTASDDYTAKLWDAGTGRELATLKGHTLGILPPKYSPDGAHVLTASRDRTARIWDAQTGNERVKIEGHTMPLLAACFSPDGKQILTGSEDKTARLWDTRTGQELAILKGHTDKVQAANYSPDSKRIFTWGKDGSARVWDAQTGQELAILKGHTQSITGVSFSHDGTRVLSSSENGVTLLWDARRGQQRAILKGHAGSITGVSFSHDGTRILTGSWDRTIRLWDARTHQEVLRWKDTAGINGSCFSPDGVRVLTAGGRTAKIWDARTGQLLTELQGHKRPVTCVSFSPDGTRVLTGSEDDTARLWDARTGQTLATLTTQEPILCVRFSRDGQRLLTGGQDYTARIWDARTSQVLATLEGHNGPVLDGTFSPDGTRVVTASEDGTARLWDATTGRELSVLQGHEAAVRSVCFRADGVRILTGSLDRTARLWDARTGRELESFKGHTEGVVSVSFSPDGKDILTGSRDGTARLWEATPPNRLAGRD